MNGSFIRLAGKSGKADECQMVCKKEAEERVRRCRKEGMIIFHLCGFRGKGDKKDRVAMYAVLEYSIKVATQEKKIRERMGRVLARYMEFDHTEYVVWARKNLKTKQIPSNMGRKEACFVVWSRGNRG